MPSRLSNKLKTKPARSTRKTEFAQRTRVLKRGSDGDIVRAFATKRGEK